MTQEINSAEEQTTTEETQATKTYTQKELDDLMAKTRSAIERKYEKKLEELGPLDELRNIKSDYEKRKHEEQVKRGEFDKVLQELASKKDAEIMKRDQVIRQYKIDTPLLSAAANYRAVNAEQVKALLANNVRLNAEGEVEVVDATGAVKYTDSGTQFSVDDLVKDFLHQNPHFVSANPATTNTKSNVNVPGKLKVDPTKLNMNDPKDREKYKQYRAENGIR